MKKKAQKPPSIRTLQKKIKILEAELQHYTTKCARAESNFQNIYSHLKGEERVSQILYENCERINNDFSLLKKQSEDFAATIRVLSGIEHIGTVATGLFEHGIVSLDNLRKYHSNKERPSVT